MEIFKSGDYLGGIEEGRCCREVASPVDHCDDNYDYDHNYHPWMMMIRIFKEKDDNRRGSLLLGSCPLC